MYFTLTPSWRDIASEPLRGWVAELRLHRSLYNWPWLRETSEQVLSYTKTQLDDATLRRSN